MPLADAFELTVRDSDRLQFRKQLLAYPHPWRHLVAPVDEERDNYREADNEEGNEPKAPHQSAFYGAR